MNTQDQTTIGCKKKEWLRLSLSIGRVQCQVCGCKDLNRLWHKYLLPFSDSRTNFNPLFYFRSDLKDAIASLAFCLNEKNLPQRPMVGSFTFQIDPSTEMVRATRFPTPYAASLVGHNPFMYRSFKSLHFYLHNPSKALKASIIGPFIVLLRN